MVLQIEKARSLEGMQHLYSRSFPPCWRAVEKGTKVDQLGSPISKRSGDLHTGGILASQDRLVRLPVVSLS